MPTFNQVYGANTDETSAAPAPKGVTFDQVYGPNVDESKATNQISTTDPFAITPNKKYGPNQCGRFVVDVAQANGWQGKSIKDLSNPKYGQPVSDYYNSGTVLFLKPNQQYPTPHYGIVFQDEHGRPFVNEWITAKGRTHVGKNTPLSDPRIADRITKAWMPVLPAPQWLNNAGAPGSTYQDPLAAMQQGIQQTIAPAKPQSWITKAQQAPAQQSYAMKHIASSQLEPLAIAPQNQAREMLDSQMAPVSPESMVVQPVDISDSSLNLTRNLQRDLPAAANALGGALDYGLQKLARGESDILYRLWSHVLPTPEMRAKAAAEVGTAPTALDVLKKATTLLTKNGSEVLQGLTIEGLQAWDKATKPTLDPSTGKLGIGRPPAYDDSHYVNNPLAKAAANVGGLLPYTLPYVGPAMMIATLPQWLEKNPDSGNIGAVDMAQGIANRLNPANLKQTLDSGEWVNAIFDAMMLGHMTKITPTLQAVWRGHQEAGDLAAAGKAFMAGDVDGGTRHLVRAGTRWPGYKSMTPDVQIAYQSNLRWLADQLVATKPAKRVDPLTGQTFDRSGLFGREVHDLMPQDMGRRTVEQDITEFPDRIQHAPAVPFTADTTVTASETNIGRRSQWRNDARLRQDLGYTDDEIGAIHPDIRYDLVDNGITPDRVVDIKTDGSVTLRGRKGGFSEMKAPVAVEPGVVAEPGATSDAMSPVDGVSVHHPDGRISTVTGLNIADDTPGSPVHIPGIGHGWVHDVGPDGQVTIRTAAHATGLEPIMDTATPGPNLWERVDHWTKQGYDNKGALEMALHEGAVDPTTYMVTKHYLESVDPSVDQNTVLRFHKEISDLVPTLEQLEEHGIKGVSEEGRKDFSAAGRTWYQDVQTKITRAIIDAYGNADVHDVLEELAHRYYRWRTDPKSALHDPTFLPEIEAYHASRTKLDPSLAGTTPEELFARDVAAYKIAHGTTLEALRTAKATPELVGLYDHARAFIGAIVQKMRDLRHTFQDLRTQGVLTPEVERYMHEFATKPGGEMVNRPNIAALKSAEGKIAPFENSDVSSGIVPPLSETEPVGQSHFFLKPPFAGDAAGKKKLGAWCTTISKDAQDHYQFFGKLRKTGDGDIIVDLTKRGANTTLIRLDNWNELGAKEPDWPNQAKTIYDNLPPSLKKRLGLDGQGQIKAIGKMAEKNPLLGVRVWNERFAKDPDWTAATATEVYNALPEASRKNVYLEADGSLRYEQKMSPATSFMSTVQWNYLVDTNPKWADTARRYYEALPKEVRSSREMRMSPDGKFEMSGLEKALGKKKPFIFQRSMMQRIVDAMPMEKWSSDYTLPDGRTIRLTPGDTILVGGGEAYRRALLAECRKQFDANTLGALELGGLKTDDWGTMGLLGPNEKTYGSGDLTTMCPQIFFNKGCMYCYRSAAMEENVNNKLAAVRVWYTGDILRLKQLDIDRLNAVGGLRIQSFGDWMGDQHAAQLTDMFQDAQKRGLRIKIVTKEPSMIHTVDALMKQDVFRPKDIVFNISADYVAEPIGPRNESSDYEPSNWARPWKRTDKGIFWKRALGVTEAAELRKQFPWVNVRIVATDIPEFIRGLQDPQVDVVTGYHGHKFKLPRYDTMTGEYKEQMAPMGDSGMPVIDSTGNFTFLGKNDWHKQLAAEVKRLGLEDEYRRKVCCIKGKCGQCEGLCGLVNRKSARQRLEYITDTGIPTDNPLDVIDEPTPGEGYPQDTWGHENMVKPEDFTKSTAWNDRMQGSGADTMSATIGEPTTAGDNGAYAGAPSPEQLDYTTSHGDVNPDFQESPSGISRLAVKKNGEWEQGAGAKRQSKPSKEYYAEALIGVRRAASAIDNETLAKEQTGYTDIRPEIEKPIFQQWIDDGRPSNQKPYLERFNREYADAMSRFPTLAKWNELQDRESAILDAQEQGVPVPGYEPQSHDYISDPVQRAQNLRQWAGNTIAKDADGNPLTLYHSTQGDFATFDASKSNRGEPLAIHVGGADAANDRLMDLGKLELAPNGVSHNVAVAFYPEDIKSAIGNQGTYSGDTGDIRLAIKRRDGVPIGDERGSIKPEMFPPVAEVKAAAEDLGDVVKMTSAMRNDADKIVAAGPDARMVNRTLDRADGMKQQFEEYYRNDRKPIQDWWDDHTAHDGDLKQIHMEFISRLINGTKQVTPEMQKLDAYYKKQLQSMWEVEKQMRPDMGYIEDYWPQDLSPKAKEYIRRRFAGERPDQIQIGRPRKKFYTEQPGFTMHREGPEWNLGIMKELIDMGLLKETNPEVLFQARTLQHIRFTYLHDALTRLAEVGALKPILGERTPGALPISGNVQAILGPELTQKIIDKWVPQAERDAHKGQWQIGADREIVDTLENQFSPSLYNGKGGAFLAAAQKITGARLRIMFAASGFHALSTGTANMSMALGDVAKSLLAGNVKQAGKDAISLLPIIGTAKDLKLGHAQLENYRHNPYEELLPSVKAYTDVGMTTNAHGDMKSNSPELFRRRLKQGAYGNAAVHGLIALAELPTNVIMNEWVPSLKQAAWDRKVALRQWQMDQGKITREEFDRLLTKDADNVENILGEMANGRLHQKRWVLNAMKIIFPTLTWRGGSARILAGAAKDTALQFRGLYEGTKTAVQGKGFNEGWKETPIEHRELTDRQAFIGGEIVTTIITAAILQRILAGVWPQSAMDCVMPRDGGKTKDGTASRLRIPMYGSRDWAALARGALTNADWRKGLLGIKEYVQAGINPVYGDVKAIDTAFEKSPLGDVAENMSYASGAHAYGEIAKAVGNQVIGRDEAAQEHWNNAATDNHLPISVSSYLKSEKQTHPTLIHILQAGGMAAAPQWATDTPAWRMIHEIRASEFEGKSYLGTEKERQQERQALVQKMKDGTITDEELQNGQEKGVITSRWVKVQHQKLGYTPIQAAMLTINNLDQRKAIYANMTKTEQTQFEQLYDPTTGKKIRQSKPSMNLTLPGTRMKLGF